MTTGRLVAIIAAVFVLCAVALAAILAGGLWLMKRTDAYRTAESFLASHPKVKELAGEDLKFGRFASIKISTRRSRGDPTERGEARVSVSVSGRSGSTKAHVVLKKKGGSWRVVRAVCLGTDGNPVELVAGTAEDETIAATDSMTQRRRQASVEAAEHLEHAYELHRAEKWEESLIYYDAALVLAPNDAEATYFRGVARAKAGKLDLALVDLLRAIELDPDRIEAYRYADWIQAQRGEWDAIIAQWTRYIERHPDSADAHCERAGARKRRGDMEAAVADAQEACRLGSDSCCRVVPSRAPSP